MNFLFLFFQTGFRESAFSYAIAAAGVTHSVARACSMGKLMACGCEPKTPTSQLRNNRLSREQRLKKLSRNRWKWGGCSHNMDFGIQFSKLLLDANERNSGDLQSLIKLHNSKAGRLVSIQNIRLVYRLSTKSTTPCTNSLVNFGITSFFEFYAKFSQQISSHLMNFLNFGAILLAHHRSWYCLHSKLDSAFRLRIPTF